MADQSYMGSDSRPGANNRVQPRWILAPIAAALLILPIGPAAAGPFWCTGKINHVLQEVTGGVQVHVSFRNDWVQICNQNGTGGGASADVCKGCLSQALSAVALGREVTFFYGDIPSCETMPTYGAAPAPGYFLLRGQ